MATFIDKKLHEAVKKEADALFLAKTSIYKSSWITREYKKRGGRFIGDKPKNTGLTRWFKEKWVDITRPNNSPCGRKKASLNNYPLCRPLNRITKDTPKTLNEINTKIITKNIKLKQKIKNKGRVSFT